VAHDHFCVVRLSVIRTHGARTMPIPAQEEPARPAHAHRLRGPRKRRLGMLAQKSTATLASAR
jgi:hypothetical protein